MSAINVFLIKEELENHHDVILDLESRPRIAIRHGRSVLGMLYIAPSHPHPPKWLKYFGPNEELRELDLTSSSASAVLLVPRAKRLFAVVFGYGRYLLQEGVVESRFGLKVALNALAPGQLRSIDHKRLDAVPRLTREQLSKSAGMEQFGLNIERDMLRAITGKPADATLGSMLSGGDQLSVTGKVPLEQLPIQLEKYLALSKQKQYREEFAWVDNIREVTDITLRGDLEDELIRLFADGETPAWLATPEMVDWTVVDGFQYGREKRALVFDDLDLETYFTIKRPREEVTREDLRNDRVCLVDAQTGGVSSSWSVFNCLVAELQLNNRRFVLNEAKWYEIDAEFFKAVDDAVARLPKSKAPLPLAVHLETEPAYSKRAFSQGGLAFALLDNKPIRQRGRSPVEVCDLYWQERTFVHLKCYGASSNLSHLFSQGVVSAQLFQQDAAFRSAFSKKLPDTHHWGTASDPIRPQEFEVAYAIITKKTATFGLPFFSKVNLRNSAALLASMGYRVSLTPIHTK